MRLPAEVADASPVPQPPDDLLTQAVFGGETALGVRSSFSFFLVPFSPLCGAVAAEILL